MVCNSLATRLCLHATALLVVLVMATTARAQIAIPEDVATVAAEAGVSAESLLGAVNTTNLDPREYLCRVGELACPRPPTPVSTVWDLLQSRCESPSGGWHTNTGNGYYGGTQTDMPTWIRYGGLAFAPRPDLATREEQITINERILAKQGWGAWPVCSRRLGLRG